MTRLHSHLALLTIILLGAFLRFLWIGEKSIWLDEAFTLWVANHSLREVWMWIERIDQHPPLFYLLLSLWVKLFGDSEAALRSLPALFGVATLPLIYAVTRQVSSQRSVALLATLFLAVSPFHIHFAQETRMYTLLALSATGVLYFALRIANGTSTVWVVLGLAFCQTLAMWTHNTSVVFLPVAIGFWIADCGLQIRRHSSVGRVIHNSQFAIRNLLLSQILAFTLWLPWAYNFAVQVRKVAQEFWIGPPGAAQIVDIFRRFLLDHAVESAPTTLWIVACVACALVGASVLRTKPRLAGLLLAFWLVPLLGELLVSLRRPILHAPSLIWTSIPLYSLIVCGIHRLLYPRSTQRSGDRFRRAGGYLVGITATLLVTISLSNYFVNYQKEEWQEVAEAVASQSTSGQSPPRDLILFNATWVQLPFEYYFQKTGVNAELRGVPVDLFERGVTEPKMTSADLPRIRQLIDSRERVWLVYSHDWYTDFQQLALGELTRQMHQQQLLEFQGVRVFEFIHK